MPAEIRAIKKNELQECLDLWNTVWSDDNSDYFRRYFYSDVEWLPEYTRVCVVDGRLVSAVQICKRIVSCGDMSLTMGGIANVATLPEFRGHGYNTACLKSAISIMEADHMDFSLLFTGINSYYAREGFTNLERARLRGAIRTGFTPAVSEYHVRPAQDSDLPDIRRIYDFFNAKRPITVHRSEGYWRDWIGIRPGKLPDALFVAVDSTGKIRGYLNCGTFNSAIPYSPEEAFVSINELGADAETEAGIIEILGAMFGAIASAESARGARDLRLDFGQDKQAGTALEPILESTERTVNNHAMVRLLHPENLIKSFTFVWNDHWIEAGRPAGKVSFKTPYGAVIIDSTGGRLNVEAAGETQDAGSQTELFELLFGESADGNPKPATKGNALLSALKTSSVPVYWGADGF